MVKSIIICDICKDTIGTPPLDPKKPVGLLILRSYGKKITNDTFEHLCEKCTTHVVPKVLKIINKLRSKQ